MAKPRHNQRPGGTPGQRTTSRQTSASGGTGARTGNGAANANRSSGSTSANGASGANGANRAGAAQTSASNSMAGKTSASADSAAMRQRVQARRNQRRYEVKRAWYQGPGLLVLAAVGVVVIVGIIILIGALNSKNNSASAHGPVPANVLDALEHPNSAIFDQVGAGTSNPGFKALPNTSGTDLPPQNGKPVLFYAGGEYCPYCAANRWALVMALNRFGSFSGLETNASMATDVYPSTPTFTFVKATYTSPYLVFDGKEVAGADPNTQLQTLTSAESNVFNTYDAPPYSSSAGGIPFIDFGGQYMTSGVSYDAGVLHANPTDPQSKALTYDQIVSGLANASNPIAQGIVGTANQYTAAICKMTNDSNKAVCSSPTIQSLESKLPQR